MKLLRNKPVSQAAESQTTNQAEKSFMDHLEDLRRTLIYSVSFLFLGMIGTFPFAPRIFALLRAPLDKSIAHSDLFLRSLEVSGAFTVTLRIAFWAGLILSAPFILFFIGGFVFPGLTRREKDVITQMFGFALALFLGGVLVGYWITLPVALKVMFGLHQWLGVQAEWTVTSYVAFASQLLLGFGLVFELPVVLLILGRLHIISAQQLREKRKIAIVLAMIIGAVLTPGPDVFSQLIMAIPLILLYELCIWLVRLSEKRAAD